MIICIQPRAVAGADAGMVRHVFIYFYFEQLGWCPLWELVPYANCVLCIQGAAVLHERELSLVLTCRVTAVFCARASYVCAHKTVYQKFKLIWL